MEFMKFTGKTEEDALTEAKIALGATTDEIEYEVLEKGTSGFLGIGSKPAVIQARKKCSVEDYARAVSYTHLSSSDDPPAIFQ